MHCKFCDTLWLKYVIDIIVLFYNEQVVLKVHYLSDSDLFFYIINTRYDKCNEYLNWT